jgi:hypothetical protein
MTLPPEPCGEHRQFCDDPLARFSEAATHLKLIGDAFRCIDSPEQLRALKELIEWQILEARRALDVAASALEVL